MHELIAHWIVAHERFQADLPYIRRACVLRYEDFVGDPIGALRDVWALLDLEPEPTKIAERFGISRQTVYNHLNRASKQPFPKPRPPRPSKLDAFRDYIQARLERFDLPAIVVLQEIRKQGYTGGITILREFIRPLKQEMVRKVTEREETQRITSGHASRA